MAPARPSPGLLAGGPACVALVALIAAGCAALWLAVPVGWLWAASQLQQLVSLGLALLIAFTGALGSAAAIMRALIALDHAHHGLRDARGVPVGGATALEALCVGIGALVAIAFFIWFLGFSGASPLPLLSGQAFLGA